MKEKFSGNLRFAHGFQSKSRLNKESAQFAVHMTHYFFLIVLGFVFLYPFLYMVAKSVMSYSDITDPTIKWFAKNPTVENYVLAYNMLDELRSGFNSLTVAAIATFGHLFSCSLIGYGLSRFEFRGKGIIFFGVILSIVIPAQNLIIPRYIIFSNVEQALGGNINLLDSYIPFLLPTFFGFGLFGGLYIFLFRQYFYRFPKTVEEAAAVDGAGPLRTFFSIVLPSAGSTIIVCLVLSIVWHWNDYYEPNIYLTSPTKWLLPQVLPDLYNRIQSVAQVAGEAMGSESLTKYHDGVVMAATAITTFPLLIMYAFLQRRFMAGVERSGLVE